MAFLIRLEIRTRISNLCDEKLFYKNENIISKTDLSYKTDHNHWHQWSQTKNQTKSEKRFTQICMAKQMRSHLFWHNLYEYYTIMDFLLSKYGLIRRGQYFQIQ